MYCPKCGGQNSDDLAYCRECGENLKIISQVMKGHAPITLVSKLDAAIDRKNERLRRDSVYWGISGVILTVGTWIDRSIFLSSWDEVYVWLFVTFIASCFLESGWKYLAYRRSLELAKRSAGSYESSTIKELSNDRIPPTPAISSGGQIDASYTGNSIYCPACGEQNIESTQFCRSCGFSLVFGKQGLERYLPGFLIQRLDSRIARNEAFTPTFRSKVGLVLVPLAATFTAVMAGLSGNNQIMFLSIFIGLSILIVNGWDMLTDRRAKTKDSTVSGSYDSKTGELPLHGAKHLGSSISDESPPFYAQETASFELSRPSVTEDTTKPLHREMQIVEESPTTRELDEPNE